LQELISESEFSRTHKDLEMRFLKIRFADCPISSSLGVLGKKWALLIIRDMAGFKLDRFNQFLKSLPGISPKVLAVRLKELEREGFIKKTLEKQNRPMIVRWSLTEKGIDTIPIEMMLTAFGSKWNANMVLGDKKPRKLHEIFDDEAIDLLKSNI
jgi:DNA-binding HxlR family transcriptional regulator